MSEFNAYYTRELTERIAGGDEAAFTLLFSPLLDKLFPLIDRLTKDRQDTQDVLQNTLLKCWLSRDKLVDVEKLDAYVYRVAVNEFHLHIRRETAENRRKRKVSETQQQLPEEETIAVMEMRESIARGIQQLSPQRQKIYRLNREQGMTIPEIAEALNLSPSTVKHTLMAALESIREHLKKDGYSFLLLLFWHFR